MLWIEREEVLEPLNRVCNEKGYKAEYEHDDRVLCPAHLVRLVDTGDAVNETLDGAEEWVGKGAFAFENACHVYTERLRTDENQREEEANLKPAVGGHWGLPFETWLELFGAQQRIDEVDEQREDDEGKKDVFEHYFFPPEFFSPSRSQPVV
jgi:hypothetical protein